MRGGGERRERVRDGDRDMIASPFLSLMHVLNCSSFFIHYNNNVLCIL